MLKATLIGYTQTADTCTVDLSDVQELVAHCAKVSNTPHQINMEGGPRLLN